MRSVRSGSAMQVNRGRRDGERAPAKAKFSRGVKVRTVSALMLVFSFLCLGAYMAGRPPDSAFGSTTTGGDSAFQGIQTVVYQVRDLDTAVRWYSTAFGRKPYIEEPNYAAFRVGGCEFGLVPGHGRYVDRAPTSLSYWRVEDANEVYRQLVKLGAKANEPLRYAGDGTLAGSVRDPFGNLIGIVQDVNEVERGF